MWHTSTFQKVNAGGRVGNSLISFSSDSLVFCERKSDSLMKKRASLPSLFCHEQPERIAHSRSFVKSDRSESLKSLFKKERMSSWTEKGEQLSKTYKNEFSSGLLIFLQAIRLNHDWITNVQSFLKSESLTVALLYRVTCANRSWSIFKMIDFEQKSEEQMSERANSQPWQLLTLSLR